MSSNNGEKGHYDGLIRIFPVLVLKLGEFI